MKRWALLFMVSSGLATAQTAPRKGQPVEPAQPSAKATPKVTPKAAAPTPATAPAPVDPGPARLAAPAPNPDPVATPPAGPGPAALLPGAPNETTPLANARYELPTSPAPLVGYAPQAAGPLPAYPGVPLVAPPLPGNPTQTVGAGPLMRLFGDVKASQPGDVLTIVITQQAVAAANADKSGERSAETAFDGGSGAFRMLPGFGLVYTGKQSGKSNEKGSFSVATTFSATVVALKPNGNLVVEGEQCVTMDGKPQKVRIRGEVRPSDVKADNTVESTRLANVTIDWGGLRDQPRKGFLATVGKALGALFGWLF